MQAKRQIRIKAGPVTALAELNATKTADAIWQALPLDSKANTWGDEIYFSIPVKLQPENGREVVSLGELGYWPPGNAFCIFFGPTPASERDEPRAASPVSIFGKLTGDPKLFKGVKQGQRVAVERA